MPDSDRTPVALSQLNAAEIEILRLLASGHTIKSMATHLGKSEFAINERLRDARRKTGVGSSRELARMLDAQEIWDRKIDLSPPPGEGDAGDRSRIGGRSRSRGHAMMIAGSLAATALLLAVTGAGQSDTPAAQAGAATAQQPALVGRWSLDTSRIPEAERPRSVTLTFHTADGKAWHTTAEIIARDGTRQFATSTASTDGGAVPLEGNMPFADRVTVRQPAANTLVMTLEKGGRPVSTRVYSVEGDDRAMKETISWAGDASQRMVTTYFRRIG